MELLFLILLCIPLIWELVDDKKGDIHPNNDWLIRGGLMLLSSAIASYFTHRGFVQSLFLSFAIFSLFFPYLYNIFNKKKPWYNYLSKTAILDKWEYWSGIPWFARMFILLIVFGTAFTVYFWKEAMVWYYPYGH